MFLVPDDSLNILLISGAYPPQSGGVATHVKYLADALTVPRKTKVQRQCRLHIITTGDLRADDPVTARFRHQLVHRFLGHGRHFRAQGEIPFEDVIRYCCIHWHTLRPHVIHVHDLEGLQIAGMLKAAFNVPVLLTLHRAPKRWEDSLPKRDTKDMFLRFAQRFGIIDRVIAPSTAYQQRLLDQGFPPEQVRLIHHGVPVKWLASFAQRESLLNEFDIPRESQVVLCPARIDRHKGIDTFLYAAALVRRQSPDRNLVFVVAGSGSHEERAMFAQLASTLGISEHVRLGLPTNLDVAHADMATLYRRSAVCVLPSRQEGFGQVLLEAAVYRRPVIGTNVGGIPDVIRPDHTGLLFNMDEPDDLARQILQVLGDKALVAKIVDNAYVQVSQVFNSDRMAGQYIEEYVSLMGAN
jgi:glycosyltransferase involved in cell wall biosynthesis